MKRFAQPVVWASALYLLATTVGAQPYRVSGMVVRIDRQHATLIVSHDTIQGLMKAMMMPFMVHRVDDLDGIEPGMNVQFTLMNDGDTAYASDLRVRPYESVEQDPLTARRLALLKRIASGRAARPMPLHTGDIVPDFHLIDQNRTAVALSDFFGKVVAVNFVYTSCALPQFCYRTANNFAVLQRYLVRSLGRKLVLLTITFDPAHDTPAVLSAYAKQWHADSRTWRFLTGPRDEVQRVTDVFGLDVFVDEGLLDHTLRHVVIDRQGRLAASVEGNQFTPEQLRDLVQVALDQ